MPMQKDALGEKKERLAACYQEYRKLKKSGSPRLWIPRSARELSFLAYEVKEIEEAQLSVGEDTRLEEQYRRFANAKKIMDAISPAVQPPGRRRYRRECIGTYQPCPAGSQFGFGI